MFFGSLKSHSRPNLEWLKADKKTSESQFHPFWFRLISQSINRNGRSSSSWANRRNLVSQLKFSIGFSVTVSLNFFSKNFLLKSFYWKLHPFGSRPSLLEHSLNLLIRTSVLHSLAVWNLASEYRIHKKKKKKNQLKNFFLSLQIAIRCPTGFVSELDKIRKN